MKYSRVAAIVAGSVVAMGAAASPALAANASGMPPMSLTKGVDTLTSQPALDLASDGSVVGQTADAATDLNNVRGDAPEKVLQTAGKATPLLGGVELGG
ncbi:hypothetical protein AB0M39_40680 [Streptomyces sp. NPDC051907]|uniref:hypothetical protein n=1 Tax=Streptomyces sp. NPDC051907 TaxID=3155284 RepID=UPI00341529CE